MALSYNLGYRESISVHPTRRQNFAGKVYSNFPNIWEWVISHLSITFHTRYLRLKFHSSSGEGERSQDQLKSLFKNVTLETTTMRLDNSEICILLKNFTKTKACDPGGYAAAAVEIIVHQGRSVVDTLVAIQRSIKSDQFRSWSINQMRRKFNQVFCWLHRLAWTLILGGDTGYYEQKERREFKNFIFFRFPPILVGRLIS